MFLSENSCSLKHCGFFIEIHYVIYLMQVLDLAQFFIKSKGARHLSKQLFSMRNCLTRIISSKQMGALASMSMFIICMDSAIGDITQFAVGGNTMSIYPVHHINQLCDLAI
jgi:hypothetical protein